MVSKITERDTDKMTEDIKEFCDEELGHIECDGGIFGINTFQARLHNKLKE